MRKQQNCRDITPLINHEEKTKDINIVKEGGGGGGMVQHPSYLPNQEAPVSVSIVKYHATFTVPTTWKVYLIKNKTLRAQHSEQLTTANIRAPSEA